MTLDFKLGPHIELPEGTDHDTVEHLLNLYWLWEHPIHPIICRAAFLRDMAEGKGQYFSSLLLNVSGPLTQYTSTADPSAPMIGKQSVLAFACTLSDRPGLVLSPA